MLERKVRVMFFCDSLTHGGSERQMLHAMRLLAGNRYDLLLGCLNRRGPFLAEVEALDIPVFEYPLRSFASGGAARQFYRLVRDLRRERVDILQTFEFYGNVFAVPAGRLARVPVVLANRRELAGDRTRWQQWAIRVACQLAHGVVANSEAAGARLAGLSRSAAKRVTVIPNGVDITEMSPQSAGSEVRAEFGAGWSAPLIGILAALRPEKDLPTFLRAAQRVLKSVAEAKFVVIGEGSERGKLEALAAELGISGQLLFVGDRRDVAGVLSALDVFVLSSSTESSPNAILEAMALRKPVVATRVGGVPDLVEEGRTGFLVAIGDAESMAARIVELLRDPGLRHSMGEAGRLRAEGEFSGVRMKQRVEALYERMLRERRPTGRILQIGNVPPPVGGWSIHTQLVDRELAARGADSRVMDIGPGRRIPGRGCETVSGGVDYLKKLLRYRLRGFTFQVHVNGDTWKGYLLALSAVLLGRVSGKPSVLTFHAGPTQIYFPRAGGFWRWAFKVLFAASGEVICNHEPVRKQIVAYGIPQKNVHTIPAFSVQYQEDIPVPLPDRVEESLSKHKPRVFSYSLFRPEFTMDALFDAFAALRRHYPGAGLLIAGPEETPQWALERMRHLGLEESVLIAGNLAHAEFLTAVQRSDLFVRTHLRDGVCSSVLEALSLGVPVVASEDGNRPPSVVTYAAGDGADLARKMREVLADLATARARVRAPETRNHVAEEVSLLLMTAGASEGSLQGSQGRGGGRSGLPGASSG